MINFLSFDFPIHCPRNLFLISAYDFEPIFRPIWSILLNISDHFGQNCQNGLVKFRPFYGLEKFRPFWHAQNDRKVKSGPNNYLISMNQRSNQLPLQFRLKTLCNKWKIQQKIYNSNVWWDCFFLIESSNSNVVSNLRGCGFLSNRPMVAFCNQRNRNNRRGIAEEWNSANSRSILISIISDDKHVTRSLNS